MNQHTRFKLEMSQLRDFIDETKKEVEEFNRITAENNLEDSQFLRRMKTRVIFSSIEAYATLMKQSALSLTIDQQDIFSEDEILKLKDLRINQEGKEVTAYQPLKGNLKLAFDAYNRAVHEEGYKADFGSERGKEFLQAVKIRNRIMHPKSKSDWQTDENESELVDKAWVWFGEHLATVGRKLEEI